MKSNPAFQRTLILSLFFSILAFCFGFGISYRQDRNEVIEIGQLAWDHLIYALELKDDMAVIDWSKNLEKLDHLLSFQVKVGSKDIAEGGNRNFLSPEIPEGVSYIFPSNWRFRIVLDKSAQDSKEFILVYHSWPGSMIWGLLVFSVCMAVGLAVGIFSVNKASLKSPKTKPIRDEPQAVNKPSGLSIQPTYAQIKNNTPSFFIDKNYIIQQANPDAAVFLQTSSDHLLNNHLLDLDPDPYLIQAIEKAIETRVKIPFPKYPNISLLLKPDPNGSLLILERNDTLESPKKR